MHEAQPREPDTGRFGTHVRTAASPPAAPPTPPSAAQTLPKLEWQEEVWEGAQVAAIGPAATRLSSYGARYKSAIAPNIADLNIQLDREVALLGREAELELARFDAEAGGRLAAFGPILLRSEAASSSQIENLSASARQIFTAEAGGKGTPNAANIAANTSAMIEAIDLAFEIDADAARKMHRTLMQGQPQHTPGQYRTEPVWIGTRAESPIGAAYVAPNYLRVPELMADLSAYVARTDIAPFEQVAIAHAQFETIHPFTDGNGRTGRALAQVMLRRSQVTRNVVVPVSAGLLADVEGYHRALTAYRQGDPNPIVQSFAAASLRAVPNGRQLVTDLETISDTWSTSAKPRQGSVKERVLAYALTRPVFTAEQISAELGLPASNVYRYLQELRDLHVLRMSVEHRGPRVWRAPAVLDAIDAFAARAGRRSA